MNEGFEQLKSSSATLPVNKLKYTKPVVENPLVFKFSLVVLRENLLALSFCSVKIESYIIVTECTQSLTTNGILTNDKARQQFYRKFFGCECKRNVRI